MRFRLIICLALLLFVAACQGPPPTMVVLIITPTPMPEVTGEATAEVLPTTAVPTAVLPPTQIPSTPSTTQSNVPTPTVGQIQVAEQVFEHGRMFWIQPQEQIWVMFDDGTGKGKWSVYPDNFQDGEPESDPSIVPPDGMYQPERGFGKLWRNTPEIKNGLGFGITPEFGYISGYEYHPTDAVDAQGRIVGFHILNSLYQEKFKFDEATGTWQKIS